MLRWFAQSASEACVTSGGTLSAPTLVLSNFTRSSVGLLETALTVKHNDTACYCTGTQVGHVGQHSTIESSVVVKPENHVNPCHGLRLEPGLRPSVCVVRVQDVFDSPALKSFKLCERVNP